MLSDKDNKQKQSQKVLDEKYKPLYDKVSKAPEQ
jgi:hypothetical protein